MNLREYLFLNELSIRDFAKLSGLSINAIYGAFRGRHPQKRTARVIYRRTKGEVKLREDIPQVRSCQVRS